MKKKVAWLLCLSLVLSLACSGNTHHRPSRFIKTHKPLLKLMGYTIQVGAFKNADNAARLTERLTKDHGLDATYFLVGDKFFKVRFGNFTTKEAARHKALSLKEKKIIEEFYIVRPEDYSAARQRTYGTDYLRNALVETAEDFIGVPYLWGGASPEEGFDCSGLTMTVYQLNGLNLPRRSSQQFEAGRSIHKNNLQRGDLLFFSERGQSAVTHVGLYIGEEKFIHASSQGGKIRLDSLSSTYFKNCYVGARTYFQ